MWFLADMFGWWEDGRRKRSKQEREGIFTCQNRGRRRWEKGNLDGGSSVWSGAMAVRMLLPTLPK